MRVVLFVVIVFAVLEKAHGCSSSPRRKTDSELKHYVNEDHVGYYSLKGELNRECNFIREETQRYKLPMSSQRSNCENLPPGLASMQHGHVNEVFSSIQSQQNLREVVFYFTCDNNDSYHRWNGYQLPKELKFLTELPRTTYDRHIVNKTKLIDAFSGEIILDDTNINFVFVLPLLRLNLSDSSFKAAAYLSVQVERFQVSFNIPKPSKQMTTLYYELPENFTKNQLPYYRFVNNFGTDVVTTTTFGGKFQVLVTSDRLRVEVENTDLSDKASLEGVLNKLMNSEESGSSRVTMLVEGGGFPASTSRYDIAQWQEFIINSPVSLAPRDIMPIYKFIESESPNVRSKGLRKMVKYEREIQHLRKVLYLMDVVRQDQLSEFLKALLLREVKEVCPSELIYSLIRKGILGPNNVDLKKYKVACTTERQWSTSDKDDVIVTNVYKLLPGLCYTIVGDATKKCTSSDFSKLPDGVSCWKFFQSYGCEGVADIIVKSSNDLKNAFNSGLRSFMYCDY